MRITSVRSSSYTNWFCPVGLLDNLSDRVWGRYSWTTSRETAMRPRKPIDEAELRKAVDDNVPLSHLAERYKVSPTTIKNRLLAMGIEYEGGKGVTRKITKEKLIDLYVEKLMTPAEIAVELGIRSATSVRQALQTHGIPVRTRNFRFPGRVRSHERLQKGHGDISGSFWCGVRNSAAVRRLPFEITPEYAWQLFLDQGGRCALSGVPLHLVRKRAKQLRGEEQQTASVDRIDSSVGYVPGNIQWVHKLIQRMKWHMPDDEFIRWCVQIAVCRGPSVGQTTPDLNWGYR